MLEKMTEKSMPHELLDSWIWQVDTTAKVISDYLILTHF